MSTESQGPLLSIKNKQLLIQIKKAVLQVEPSAKIILYGSRARNEEGPESDWDLLILIDEPLTEVKECAIRRQVYQIEWAVGEVLCTIIRTQKEWKQPLVQATPFYQNIAKEGMVI